MEIINNKIKQDAENDEKARAIAAKANPLHPYIHPLSLGTQKGEKD
jgi:hypothetical protein